MRVIPEGPKAVVANPTRRSHLGIVEISNRTARLASNRNPFRSREKYTEDSPMSQGFVERNLE